MSIREKLVNAVISWDIRQSVKRNYNPYGLGIMMERAEMVSTEIERGEDTREAIMSGFNDRLLDFILKKLDLPVATTDEHRNAPITYNPKNQ